MKLINWILGLFGKKEGEVNFDKAIITAWPFPEPEPKIKPCQCEAPKKKRGRPALKKATTRKPATKTAKPKAKKK
jgi:hypothetical protein